MPEGGMPHELSMKDVEEAFAYFTSEEYRQRLGEHRIAEMHTMAYIEKVVCPCCDRIPNRPHRGQP